MGPYTPRLWGYNTIPQNKTKALFQYFAFSLWKQWAAVISILVFPVIMPYFFNVIMDSVTGKVSHLRLQPYDVPQLPPSSLVSSLTNNTVYFSYAPATEETESFMNQLLRIDGLDDAKLKPFLTIKEAEHYINVKNLVRDAPSHFKNTSFYTDIICQDLRKFNPNVKDECAFDFSESYKDTLITQYGLQEEDFSADFNEGGQYDEDILFHINFHLSDEVMYGIPQNITYEVVYNQSLLDRLVRDHPDTLSAQFGNNMLQPYWTGYSATLQNYLDQITLKKYTGISLEQSFTRPEEMSVMDVSIEMFCEMCCLLGFAINYIISVIIASQNRGKIHLILRRLGVKDLQYWVVSYVIVLLPCFVSCLICGITWHYTGVLPFSSITMSFVVFEMLVMSLLITASALFLASVLGQVQVVPVTCSCFLALFLIIMAGIFHTAIFSGQSLFDPSMVPQWGTWLSMCILPPFTVVGLMDSMTSGLSQLIIKQQRSSYDWKMQDTLVPIQYLFTNYQNYTSRVRQCVNINSYLGELDSDGKCVYHQPSYGFVVMLALVEALILLPTFTVWFSYVITEKGNRGLPVFFFLKRNFWYKVWSLRPGDASVSIKNLTVAYKAAKQSKKQIGSTQQFQLKKNLALKQVSYEQGSNVISALVGESGAGKTTLLSFLAGELGQFAIKQIVPKKYRSEHHARDSQDEMELLHGGEVTKQDYNNNNSVEQLYRYIQGHCQEPSCSVLGNYDLLNPIDAHLVKPYIGHLAQDFSNVWMELTCFQNVYFSLVLRTENQGRKFRTREMRAEAGRILTQMGLEGRDVLRRKACRLSGGMLRRLALCNAIAGGPRLLLLDEISAGVDPVIKRRIWKCVQALKRAGDVSIILSTHDTDEIQEMAQKITIIDQGFKIVNDISPFDLRQESHTYTIKFYNKEDTCSRDMANGILDELKRRGIVRDVSINIVSPHGINFLIRQRFSPSQVLELCGQLEDITRRYQFDDYILSKAKLDDVYIDIIGYQRDNNAVQEDPVAASGNTSKKCTDSRVLGLLRTSLMAEFKNRFPSVCIICIVVLILAILFHWECSLMDKMMDTVNKANVIVNRQYDLAKNCLADCVNLYADNDPVKAVERCFKERPGELRYAFDGQSPEMGQDHYQRCGYYFDYLGLDHKNPYYIAIGDRRYNNLESTNYMFSFNRHENATRDLFNPQVFLEQDRRAGAKYTESTVFNVSVDYAELYRGRGFDPTVNKSLDGRQDTLGVLPFIQRKHYIQAVTSGCSLRANYRRYCHDVGALKNGTCENDQFDIEDCLRRYAGHACDGAGSQVLRQLQTYQLIDQPFIEQYKQSVQQQRINTTIDMADSGYRVQVGELTGPWTLLSNFDVKEYDVKYNNASGRFEGRIAVEQTNLLPNRGTTSANYAANIETAYVTTSPKYTCNNTYEPQQALVVQSLPGMITAHRMANNVFMQSLPDRSHAVLFDISNEPQTQLVGALIRKQIFQQSPPSDYGAWDFVYSLVARAMPVIADPNYVKASQLSEAQFSEVMMVGFLAVSIMFISMYVGIKFGAQIESNILRLLQLHFVSPIQWYFTELLSNIITSLIPLSFFIVVISVLLPKCFYHSAKSAINIAFYCLAGFENVVFGMMISIILRRVKGSTLTSFFFMVFIAVFNMFLIGNKLFTYLIGIIVPSYSIQYQYYQTIMDAEMDWAMVVFSVVITLLQVFISVVITNWIYISAWCKRHICRKSAAKYRDGYDKIRSQAESSLSIPNTEAQYALQIQNVHHIYDTGTYALKGVSIDIPRGITFGLLGSNGCGKSTLMNCLAGIYRPTAGSAIVSVSDGTYIDLFRESQTSKYFSVVPQHDIYWPNLTVYDHLSCMRQINALRDPVNIELLMDVLQLQKYRNFTMGQLSDGVRRRVSIAMALTTSPPILALDEPSCGLGVTTKRFVHDAILSILNQNTTMVLTTHDMGEVEQLVDKCCIMSDGRVLELGSISQLRKVCKAGLVLTVKKESQAIEDITAGLDCLSYEYNDMNETYVIQMKQGVTELCVLQALDRLEMLDGQWNIEVLLMESVFLEIISQTEQLI